MSIANITLSGPSTIPPVVPVVQQPSGQTGAFAGLLSGATGSSSTGTTNLFQQLTSDLQAFLLQLQGGGSSIQASSPSSTTTPTNVSTNPSGSVDGDGDSDGSAASSQGSGQVQGHHHHHHHFDTQQTGGISQFMTDATNLLNDLKNILGAGSAGPSGSSSSGSSSSGSSSNAAVQAYTASNAQPGPSILQQIV